MNPAVDDCRRVASKRAVGRSLAAMALVCLVAAQASCAAVPVTLVKDGEAQMPILAGSVAEPAAELQKYIKRISGAEMEITPAAEGAAGVYVGLASDFPWLSFSDVDKLGPEGFILRSDGKNLCAVANGPLGVRHAVSTLLHKLGCRWFFPGKVWQVVRERKTLVVAADERQTPSFTRQRRLWYGFGAYPPCKKDYDEWIHHNRMGSPIDINIGHTWYGIDRDADFEKHPEWFALVGGQQRKSKPCYSNPEVIQQGIRYAMAAAEKAGGKGMVTMSPPDGLGYCECEKCFAVFQGGKPDEEMFKKYRSRFGRRPDGQVVNATSETLFAFVNKVAEAVSKKYPQMLLGVYAYSAYSHPPTFKMHPNVYVQTTTSFRRTPLSLVEQLHQWGEKTAKVDIRGYWSVYQWDWDGPNPGKMAPTKVQEQLKFFKAHDVTGVNSEASNNWGVRGVGYYVASRLLWDVNGDLEAILRDFYTKAFGPAAQVMQRYYERSFALSTEPRPDPADELAAKRPRKRFDLVEHLQAAYADLDEASALVEGMPAYRDRVDHIRMYLHYLFLRSRVDEAARTGEKDAIIEAVKNETVFGGRLTHTNMLHSRPLIGKAFHRRFRRHMEILKDVPELQTGGKSRQVGTPPTHEELDQLWAADKAAMGVR